MLFDVIAIESMNLSVYYIRIAEIRVSLDSSSERLNKHDRIHKRRGEYEFRSRLGRVSDGFRDVSKVSTIFCETNSVLLHFNGRETLVCGRVVLVKRKAYERRPPLGLFHAYIPAPASHSPGQ